MQIEKIAVEKLKAAEYNPRRALKPGDAEYEKLKRSIKEFGYVEPVIWNKQTGNVVGGHQRLTVMKDLGITEIDCVVVDLVGEHDAALEGLHGGDEREHGNIHRMLAVIAGCLRRDFVVKCLRTALIFRGRRRGNGRVFLHHI